jgi:alpha-L-fucosidase
MRLRFCTYYLNRAKEWSKEVVIVRKQDDLPLDCSVEDLEKSRKNHLAGKAWMTDETISNGSWCFTENLQLRSSRDLLHVLIDIVSKNGVLLLNISPRPDGIIPGDQQQVLLEIGAWLDRYGEAIYGTRPWYTFGEGITPEPEGHYLSNAFQKITYTAEDIRYTTTGNTIYAIFLGKPDGGKKILFEAFAAYKELQALQVSRISIPGDDHILTWSMDASGLSVRLPESGLDEMATVLKIEMNENNPI